MSFIKSLTTLGEAEVTNVTTIADYTLVAGFNLKSGEACAYVVYVTGTDKMERVVPTSKQALFAIVRLLVEGDEGNEEMYDLITDADLPIDPVLRPIP